MLHTYMVKCGKHLEIFCLTLIHSTCLAQVLSLVAEVIQNQYEDVNGLISNVKEVFPKAHLRIQAFWEALSDCLLPPEPVMTKWS